MFLNSAFFDCVAGGLIRAPLKQCDAARNLNVQPPNKAGLGTDDPLCNKLWFGTDRPFRRETSSGGRSPVRVERPGALFARCAPSDHAGWGRRGVLRFCRAATGKVFS